jgi:RNA polymerase sigma-B factor
MPTSTQRERGRVGRDTAAGAPGSGDRLECDRDLSREAMIERYLPLARKLAWRYSHSSIPYEDLAQVASLGLVKAVDRFDADRGTSFQAFAVPTMLGELKRHFRESAWALHVARGTKERALAVSEATDVLSNRNGRAPAVRELADYLELSEEDVLDGLQAAQAYTATSLEEPRSSEDGDGATVETELGANDEQYEQVEEKLAVTQALPFISREDRRLLRLRFVDEMTQTQIARRLGISQMQVSRRLRSSLERLRAVILADHELRQAARGPALS